MCLHHIGRYLLFFQDVSYVLPYCESLEIQMSW